MSAEFVVLVDDDGNAIGTAPKAEVHHESTPLHLAFSCYVFDADGRTLLSQRALHKATWPGVWSNSFCGHPGPGEDLANAVRRRAQQELGLTLESLKLVLPAFRYEATMSNGVRENELCPVYVAAAASDAVADPAEVAELKWVDWPVFRDAVLAGQWDVSPWCAQQVTALATVEEAPGRFTTASPSHLPIIATP